MASVSVALLSFAHNKFGGQAGEDPDSSTSTSSQELPTDHVVYACFYVSTLLSITPGAFAWLTHGGMIQIVSSMVTRQMDRLPRRRST